MVGILLFPSTPKPRHGILDPLTGGIRAEVGVQPKRVISETVTVCVRDLSGVVWEGIDIVEYSIAIEVVCAAVLIAV